MKNYNFLTIRGMPLLLRHLQNIWKTYGEAEYFNRTKDSEHDLVNLHPKHIKDHLAIYLLEQAIAPIENCKFFICKPGEWGEVHVDGGNPPRNFAINFPLYGCNSGVMNWFSNTPSDETFISNEYTNVHSTSFKADPSYWLVEEQMTLTRPAVVRTNGWHNVDNRDNEEYRIVFSIRLQDNPSYELAVDKLSCFLLNQVK